MTAACPKGHALVVVDAADLAPEREPDAACVALDEPVDGLAALRGAGHRSAPTARDGTAFVCRIDDLPAADQRIATEARASYREDCVDTPPPTAYWSFWVADPGSCSWTYATSGASGAMLEPGGAHGWTFALDAPAGSPPEPRVDPCSTTVEARIATAVARRDDARDQSGTSASRIDPLAGAALLVALLAIAALAGRRRRARGGARGRHG